MRKLMVSVALAAAVLACNRPVEQARKTTRGVASPGEAEVAIGKPDNALSRAQQRFDLAWRQLQSFRAQQAARQAQQPGTVPAEPPQPIQFVSGVKQSFRHLDMNLINTAPVSVPITGDVRGPSVLKAQVFLDRAHFSVGAIDGGWGKNSSIAVWQWQRSHGMPATGDVDEATFRSIAAAGGYVQPLVQYHITDDDLKGPFVHLPDSVYDKQKLPCMCYETLREELAEKFHADQDFLSALNPDVKFSELRAGDTIVVPNVRPPVQGDAHDIAKIVISISGNSFDAFDANSYLIFHAPTTVGSKYDPSPDETLHIIKIIDHPHFHYDPTLYAEVPDNMPDAHLSPGPNSPVGIVWMALSKEHYGIHGTEDPESIGYASSHGCVRLTNWDAFEVEHRASEGTVVAFVDTKK
jgi:lipoprotein-anchoring transpeptidase ErfK/SrfK